MEKQRVLFVCIHNSARSQMAEALLRLMAGDRFAVASAGLEPGRLNPVVVEALKEDGIDITGKATQAVGDLLEAGERYDYVITVCDGVSAQRCPVFPGAKEKLHWSFADPSGFGGSPQEQLEQVRGVKAEIQSRLKAWLKDLPA